ncbi:hypothetical protein Cgig2_006991 [Carnegiea gigantea]|uniref:Uncharacterized protein n=1 Tax=Carnegiea gigantea TaxID=171969 RepID=A0A9Q1K9N9_9CARY|nr:hypothetical protein Cgig2_015008 [Carnegiea gigantea]KAJ8439474.1 hypothetical protein Cgig2_006991 [Carnegiea gigantea]
MDSMQKATAEQANAERPTSNKHSMNRKLITYSADSDYASSVLTDKHQAEGLEMLVGGRALIEICESMSQSLVAFQCGGVSPAELRKKLSDVLMKQQENHILELESELHLAYAKLKEKEAELQALKDSVKHLIEFSLSTVSGMLLNASINFLRKFFRDVIVQFVYVSAV